MNSAIYHRGCDMCLLSRLKMQHIMQLVKIRLRHINIILMEVKTIFKRDHKNGHKNGFCV